MMKTNIQKHILEHCRNQHWDAEKSVDQNVSAFNMQCLIGMVETGEATFADLEAVGGRALVAAVAKHAVTPAQEYN